jgi:hypothetical protein
MKRSEPESHQVTFDRKSFEYPLIDKFDSLPGKEAIFELNWEHMPVIGPILKHKIPLKNYNLPEKLTQQPNKAIILREYDYEDEY